ncbi:MBL fold metallo-hydrolase [Altererythrobacter arenosus]|uniref:MBL fold metallo-hydrolase n=1 Tax=Altererythrobacter arenosus TaxID=3032592 RepID=A0ABY8FPE3_9SPHN|nr:MBL fold metallo-hydrolase [Altererythrobacter sp. CAU 1644]WFL76874.1 MBL fold metallo-hydrolase [Altererythrobacter sp. CAU 1644]
MSLKKIVLGLLGATLLAVVAIALFGQRWIGERVYNAAVERQVGIDRSATLPDGLHVYVCGSGSPMPDAERAGPCLAVLAGRKGYIFDAGSGSIRKLGRMGFPMASLDAAFLTHLHSDHLDGLGELMLQAWMAGGRASPLPIYGPEGTERVVAGFIEAYDIDRGFRIAHHGPEVARPGGFGGEAKIVDDGFALSDDTVSIRALRIDHAPVDHAFAFRIEYGGRTVVISGDGKYSGELAEFSKGADVMFHEALNPQMVGKIGATLQKRGQPDGAKIMADIPDYHTSPEDAARVAQQAGAKTLVLYHLVPAPPARLVERFFMGEAPELFDGDLRMAKDGMLVSLPAKDQSIEIDQLL